MTPPPVVWGNPLTEADYQSLESRWISGELADRAYLRRVDSLTGREMFSRKRGDAAGITIPNLAPWDARHVREYRIRLDNPDLERKSDGSLRETNKYLQPPGRPSLIYFPPGVTQEMLEDNSLTVVITEGEFKNLGPMAPFHAQWLRAAISPCRPPGRVELEGLCWQSCRS